MWDFHAASKVRYSGSFLFVIPDTPPRGNNKYPLVMAPSTGNSSLATTTKSKPQSKSKSKKEDNEPSLSANFAQSSSSMIGYDHEVYLQLIAGGKSSTKTANQVYREVCV